MHSEKTRNLIVGFTTLAAIAVLMYGIVILGKSPTLSSLHSYEVTLYAPNANGCANGAKVNLNGVVIGQVKDVAVGDFYNKFQAKFTLSIEGNYHIPSNASASLVKDIGLGTPYVSLNVYGPAASNLAPNAELHASSSGDAGSIIPKEITDQIASVSKDLSAAARDLHMLLAYHTPEEIAAAATQPASATEPRPVENISTLIYRLNHTMKSVDSLLTDSQMQGQIREIVQNIDHASKQLNITLAGVDSTVKDAAKAFDSFGEVAGKAAKTLDSTQTQILRISEKLVEMLGQIEKTTRQLTEGNGTTGKLINDPRLYDGLVDLSKSLRSTVTDLDFLLKKWQDQGVDFHLK